MKHWFLISPFVLAAIVLAVIIAAIPVDVLSVPPDIAITKFGQNLDRLLTFRSLPKEVGQMLIAVLVLALFVVLYFIPAGIGFARGKRNATAILVLNLFLGWTFVGWVIALVWALMGEANPRHAPNQQAAR